MDHRTLVDDPGRRAAVEAHPRGALHRATATRSARARSSVAVEVYGADKIVFGSDGTHFGMDWTQKAIDEAHISDADKDLIRGGNAAAHHRARHRPVGRRRAIEPVLAAAAASPASRAGRGGVRFGSSRGAGAARADRPRHRLHGRLDGGVRRRQRAHQMGSGALSGGRGRVLPLAVLAHPVLPHRAAAPRARRVADRAAVRPSEARAVAALLDDGDLHRLQAHAAGRRGRDQLLGAALHDAPLGRAAEGEGGISPLDRAGDRVRRRAAGDRSRRRGVERGRAVRARQRGADLERGGRHPQDERDRIGRNAARSIS